MYSIRKITASPVVDFAAEELKKYLRMMMPRCGEIPISYDPAAAEGFRLGLMADFGLPVDTDEPELDDILHIDTDANGGIIAGSNPRSVLLAVYQYLKENGCRWLFPGIDGEYIPIRDIQPVFYHKMAANRYRGQCNEGSEAQQNMLETIDFAPKIGLNVYMLEFDVPYHYYSRWYDHEGNDLWEPEPVSKDTVLQWKRMCEAEMSKRGLQFHDMGHGWTAEPFGFDSSDGWRASDQSAAPQENMQYLAMINGERAFFLDTPLDTQFCMSNPAARKIFVDYVADYAQKQNNVDYLHIWLADAKNNHCECEVCVTKTTSDWYVILLNELDEEFTRRSLNTRLVFIVYTDTTWAPEVERITNSRRYSLLFAPIYRNYSESYATKPDLSTYTGYNRNKNIPPQGMAATLACLEKWKQTYSGNTMAYEYHFHWLHYCDPGYTAIAQCLFDDIRALKLCGLNGFIEDQSQRNYFPTGFPMYVYGHALFDGDVTMEQLEEDYFRHAFGEHWQAALAYLKEISRLFDFRYMSSTSAFGSYHGVWEQPEQVAKLRQVAATVDGFAETIRQNLRQPMRAQSVSWQLLQDHMVYCKGFAEVCIRRGEGDPKGALEAFDELRLIMAQKEARLQRYFDLGLWNAYPGRGLRKAASK